MPWQGSRRYAYEFLTVLEHAPMQSGVFLAVARDECVFVGEADNICGQLLLHLEGDDRSMARHRPTHFAFELVAPQDREARRQELIQEFLPACNAGRIVVTYSKASWSPNRRGAAGLDRAWAGCRALAFPVSLELGSFGLRDRLQVGQTDAEETELLENAIRVSDGVDGGDWENRRRRGRMVENQSKLEAAFLAGRMDAGAERMGMLPEGVEELLRMVLSEGDCMSLARLSKVLFHATSSGRPVRVTAPVVTFPLGFGGVGSSGDHGRG